MSFDIIKKFNDGLQTLLCHDIFKNVHVKLKNEEKITHSQVCQDIFKKDKFLKMPTTNIIFKHKKVVIYKF